MCVGEWGGKTEQIINYHIQIEGIVVAFGGGGGGIAKATHLHRMLLVLHYTNYQEATITPNKHAETAN